MLVNIKINLFKIFVKRISYIKGSDMLKSPMLTLFMSITMLALVNRDH